MCAAMGLELELIQGRIQMESLVPRRSFHIATRQGQGLGPIVSYSARPIPYTGPGPFPNPVSVQC